MLYSFINLIVHLQFSNFKIVGGEVNKIDLSQIRNKVNNLLHYFNFWYLNKNLSLQFLKIIKYK